MSDPSIEGHHTSRPEMDVASAFREFGRGRPLDVRISRHQFLTGVGVTLLAACTRSSKTAAPSAHAGSIHALIAGASEVSVFGTGADAPPMNPGINRLGAVLMTLDSKVIEGGTAQVWVAKDRASKAMGPYAATWYPLTGYEKTHDRSPKSPLPGVFASEIDLPAAGIWNIAVTVQSGSRRFAGTGLLQVTDATTPAGLGSKAIRVPTPVATSATKIKEICTRTPVDALHYTSLDDALSNGKPTVISFATPLLCTTRTCAPVVDEQILTFDAIGKDRANFIHVEEFLPGKDLRPPPATAENLSAAFKAWGFDTDPWLVITDKDGVIRFRALGVVAAAEIARALQPML